MRLCVDNSKHYDVSHLEVSVGINDGHWMLKAEYLNLNNHERERIYCSTIEVLEDKDDGK